MRHLKIIFILIFSSLACFSREIFISNHNLKYTLKYDEQSIHYKTIDADYSFKKEECNTHIIKRFAAEMDKFLKDPFPNVKSQDFFGVKLDGAELYSPRIGERALFLMNMHHEIKKLKIEESFNCAKKVSLKK